jgi:hypothetical protein
MEKRFIAVDEPLPGAAAQAWIAKGADFVAGWLGGAVRNGAVAPGSGSSTAMKRFSM